MTAEQIASLRGGTEPGYQDLLDRLLEERRRLLDAAKHGLDAHLDCEFCDERSDAIAFAEAPGP